jgi:hypothetical protein
MNRITLVLLGTLVLGGCSARAGEAVSTKQGLQLSEELMELLRAEMRALLTGIRSLPAGIATADWRAVAETSAQISASYILEQKLSPAQRDELGASLPEHFRRLDAGFHREAEKLGSAALNHDAQLAAFHYYRMLETCTACHATYAPARFPGFLSDTESAHEH